MFLQSSYYQYNSSVSYTSGRVQSVEKPNHREIPYVYGYGEDSGGGDTAKLLQYLVNRFGSVASFSGTYRANRWRVNMIFQEGMCMCMCNVNNNVMYVNTCTCMGQIIVIIVCFCALSVTHMSLSTYQCIVLVVIQLRDCAKKS